MSCYLQVVERPANRIEAIDALRGLALLGVLINNLDTEFRVTFFEQFLPLSSTTVDRFAQMGIGLLIEFKAITIFSMLFGVGLAIQADTLARRGSVPRLLTRRLLVLLAFGLVHLLLIWNGDILTEYAIAGLIALPFVLASQRVTLAASAVALLLFTALSLPLLSLPFPSAAWMAQHVFEARQVYGHGSLIDVLRFRIAETPSITVFLLFIFPRTVALMLLGAWAWKSGLIRNTEVHARLLRNLGLTGLTLGLLLSWSDGVGIPAPVTLPSYAAQVIDVFAPMVLAIGYAATALWYFDRSPTRLMAWTAPVGRMAFTNYIAQSVILSLLFYGYGLGLLGQVGVVAGVGIALAIFAAQVFASRWWLRRYYYGPLEWLWRTGMYGTRQPWRKSVREHPIT